MKKRALVSVSDKTGVVEFVKGLLEQGIEVISTGGTKKLLEENGLQVIGISEVTVPRNYGWSCENITSKYSWWSISSSR